MEEAPIVSASRPWPETVYSHPRALKDAYRQGILFRQWLESYKGHLLFCNRMLSSRQIPHSGPIDNPLFFNEFLMGTKYLDAGYEVLFFYRQVEDEACYQKACELLGGTTAAQFVTPNSERDGRAPDLLVFDPKTSRFRFVECKRVGEPFTRKQPQRFAAIERYLNQTPHVHGSVLADPQRATLFPPLWEGQWIHIARLKPA